ncbi:MAG: hypothetical protein J0I75_10640 [Hyphomicrobium sp.]|nr:hypothetical protein [Hyphomicrobium sp.]ODT17987.1 MAG: hypothetical protein ABS54_16840 [Hyphomicrobium sp. SCN 65-11]
MTRLLAALGTAGLVAIASALPAASAPVLKSVAGVSQPDVTTVQDKKPAKKKPAKKATKKAPKKAPEKK